MRHPLVLRLNEWFFAPEENVEEFDAAIRRWREEPEGVQGEPAVAASSTLSGR